MKVRFVASKVVSIAAALGSFAAIWVWAAFAGRGDATVEQPATSPQVAAAQYSAALPASPAVASQAPVSRNVPTGGAVVAPARRAAVIPRPVTRTRVS